MLFSLRVLSLSCACQAALQCLTQLLSAHLPAPALSLSPAPATIFSPPRAQTNDVAEPFEFRCASSEQRDRFLAELDAHMHFLGHRERYLTKGPVSEAAQVCARMAQSGKIFI